MTFDQWHASGQYFNYQQHQIFYQQQGSGATLVLLHGFPTASWDWHKIWPQLIKNYQVVALDFIGFGWSDKPRSYEYSLMDQADVVEALLKELGIKEYHLLAHDYGATVAQELLARYYDRETVADDTETKVNSLYPTLQSVCLLNGGVFPGTHHPRPIQRALASPIGFLLTPFLNKAKLRRNFNVIFGPATQASEQEIDEFYKLMEHKRGKYLFHRLIRYMREREIHEKRWVGALTIGKLPQCFINGSYDPISGNHVADYYEQVVPNADVVRLAQIGHYPQTEAPEAVVAAFRGFQEKLN